MSTSALQELALSPRRWHDRDREVSAFATCLIVVSVLFAAWPQLDLRISAAFHVPGQGFVAAGLGWVRAIHLAVPWWGRTVFVLAVAVAVFRWVRRRRKPGGMPSPAAAWLRRIELLGWSMLLGVGLVVNGGLKETWGRARPVAVQAFGGPATFVPALRPGAQCSTNCSFTSGHAATGFALAAVGLLSAPRVRRRWLVVGAVAGLLLGLLRVAQGGHFASDVLFSGLALWGCHLVLRTAWLRLRLRRRRHRPQGDIRMA